MPSQPSQAQYPVQTSTTDPAEIMPASAAAANHGRTIAGWALFWIVIAGAIIIAIGLSFGPNSLIVPGIVVVAVGIIASAVLRALGYGQPVPPRVEPKL